MRPLKLVGLFLIVLAFTCTTSAAYAQKRVALVIGNGAYTTVSGLANPPSDARLMAGTLRGLGFEVIERIDASQRTMKTAVRDFGDKLEAGGNGTVALFYYAGHGVQVKGTNYIIPVDAHINKEGDVDIEAIDANAVLSMMEHSGSGLNFVILDACRNNPFLSSSRSGGRGLAEMDAPTGSFIAYATSPGNIASDGDGKNSPYTMALVKGMNEPGVSVERMFRNVRNEVRQKTNNDQTPWESSSLIGGDFFFNPDGAEATQSTTPTTPAAQQSSPTPDMMVWQTIQSSTDITDFEIFIGQYPSSLFVPYARSKINKLKPAQNSNSSKRPANEWWSEAEIRKRIIGTGVKFTGSYSGKVWIEEYLSNGTISASEEGDPFDGKWSLHGDLMCWKYPEEEEYCSYFSIIGDDVLWWDEDGDLENDDDPVTVLNLKKK